MELSTFSLNYWALSSKQREQLCDQVKVWDIFPKKDVLKSPESVLYMWDADNRTHYPFLPPWFCHPKNEFDTFGFLSVDGSKLPDVGIVVKGGIVVGVVALNENSNLRCSVIDMDVAEDFYPEFPTKEETIHTAEKSTDFNTFYEECKRNFLKTAFPPEQH